ncbi:MAG: ABC transporter ATP-binding protein [Proteobacteria bacterium]|nr:ABC transporter ATP-binding protein [Pseudomonadota bacterium]MBU1709124.1 ABC transporter ATP-binding protein [Pseudomonadota bacterium]
MNHLLEIINLVKTFPEVRAVDGISFHIESGECFGLLGPNGAGKTTTIEVIEGISKPTSGEILYKGKPREVTFKEEIGIQLQNTELPQYLTVKETLETFRNLYNKKADLDELVSSCRLEDLLNRDNRKISGGQKQRLLLSIALANDPELVFLDEPTTGLDPQARRYLWDIVRKIKANNKTVVLTTHYMEEAQILCDRIAIMDNGKIIAMGSPRELLEKYCKGSSIILRGDIADASLDKLPCTWFRIEDRIEIRTEAANECITHLMELDIDLTSMTVRAQNLEDLFLKLTGKEIRS